MEQSDPGEVTGRSVMPPFIARLARWWLRRCALRGPVVYEKGLRVASGALIAPPQSLAIGRGVSVGRGTVIMAGGSIGDYCLISANCLLVGREDHALNEIGCPVAHAAWVGDRTVTERDVLRIGQDVWIGAGAVVLSGSHVSSFSVVAAGAGVTKDVPEFSIVAGNPARIVGQRFSSDEERESHRVKFAERLQNATVPWSQP
jgi:acetyltransferase-like isoleucine patch superfamily enzyme